MYNPRVHIIEYLLDIMAAVKITYSGFVNKIPPESYISKADKNKIPVILIPGIGNRWGAIKHLADLISSQGYPLYVIPDLKNNLLSVEKSAEIVKAMIDKNNLKNVILVGYSKGGLIGKYLMVLKNEDENKRHGNHLYSI